MEKWPLCDCLVSFHSKGFPLHKAQAYAQLRKPYIINNLDMQHDLQVRFLTLNIIWRPTKQSDATAKTIEERIV